MGGMTGTGNDDEARAVGPIMATQLDDEGKPTGEPFEFATGGIVGGARVTWTDPPPQRTRWVSRPDPVELTLKLTPNWPSFSRVLGVPGCRDEVDYRLATKTSLAYCPGTAAHGSAMGRMIPVGGIHKPASVREGRFFREAVEARGLRLHELVDLPGRFYVCTPSEKLRLLFASIRWRMASGERWHVEPIGSPRLRSKETQAKLFERLRAAGPVSKRRFSEHDHGLAADIGASSDLFRVREWRPVTTVDGLADAVRKGHEIQFRPTPRREWEELSPLPADQQLDRVQRYGDRWLDEGDFGYEWRSRPHRHTHVAPSALTRQPDGEQRDV